MAGWGVNGDKLWGLKKAFQGVIWVSEAKGSVLSSILKTLDSGMLL